MFKMKTRLVTAFAGLCLAVAAGSAFAAKDRLTVDLVNEPSSLDPQVQWNPDSYSVYRNIFDNLITRDNKGDIVPQIASSWKQISEAVIEFQIRSDVVTMTARNLRPRTWCSACDVSQTRNSAARNWASSTRSSRPRLPVPMPCG